uniref:C2H2-type domain-containing protein n=1 Tax=Sus scrofa TaxID=9823 RepID=A0A8D0SD12_PIG
CQGHGEEGQLRKIRFKSTPTQDSPGASTTPSALSGDISYKWFHRTQPPRDSLPPGHDGDFRANLDAALGVPSNFPGSGRYFCTQEGVDTSPDSSSLACVPKVGGNWDLSTQRTQASAKGSASLAAAALAKVQKGFKDLNLAGAGEGRQNKARPYNCLPGGAFQKPSHPLGPTQTPGTRPYAGKLCEKTYSHRGTLQQHQLLHTGERPYQCPFCDKACTWSSDHRKHIRTHTGEKPYPCPDFGKAFVRSSDPRKHQRNMHSNKPLPCAEGGLTFNKPLSLLCHQRTPLVEKPFCCPARDREVAVASRMMEHQRVHSGERPCPCPTDGKCFTKSSNLMEHQTLHPGQRPFKCADCGVAFEQPSRATRASTWARGPFPAHSVVRPLRAPPP